MRCSYTMMSSKVTSPEEEGGADVDGAEWDGVEYEEGAAESDYRELSSPSLLMKRKELLNSVFLFIIIIF